MQRFLAPFRFLYSALRGHWLRPWRSPYLRWRIETWSGIEARSLTTRQFLSFVWRNRRALFRYLTWASREGV
ncbi:MAG: hypothetical protein KGN84_12410 [Acidobacteriota bacterium]|nr:hypothetical protein [Acidobacteriota bacterium]